MIATRTSHPHSLDAIEGLLARRHVVVDELMWQAQLVQHLQPASLVLDGFESRHLSDLQLQ